MSEQLLHVAAVVEPSVPGEVLPTPTPEQVQTSDQAFATGEHRYVAADLIGIVASAQLLHDLALDTLDSRKRREQLEKQRELEQASEGE